MRTAKQSPQSSKLLEVGYLCLSEKKTRRKDLFDFKEAGFREGWWWRSSLSAFLAASNGSLCSISPIDNHEMETHPNAKPLLAEISF